MNFGKFSEKFYLNLEKGLKKARIEIKPEKYFEEILLKSLLLGIGAWFAAGLYSGKIISSFFAAIIFSVLCVAIQLYLPKRKAKKTAELIERDLPFALLSMSAELNMGVSFEKSIENISKGDYGILSKEAGSALREIRGHGKTVQESLKGICEKTDSLLLKRAISQLVGVYEQGQKKDPGEPIKSIALEILSKQKAEAKEFSGKLVVFSLMFIAVSAIVPAIFQSMIIVGSFFMKIKFTPIQIIIIIAIVFPIIDMMVFFYIKSKLPVFLEG